MFTECLEIWKDWIHLEMNIDDVALQRKRLMLFGLNLTDNESPDEGQDHVSFITAGHRGKMHCARAVFLLPVNAPLLLAH